MPLSTNTVAEAKAQGMTEKPIRVLLVENIMLGAPRTLIQTEQDQLSAVLGTHR